MGLFNDAFLPFIAKTRPVLLILDNHVSHWSAYAIDAGRDNGVDLQFFPSHSFLHLLQPLDVVYFHALKQRCRYISRSEGTSGSKFFKGNCLPKYSCSLWVTSLGLPCLCPLLSQQLGVLPSIQLLLLLSRKLLRLQTKKRLLKTQRNKVVTNVEDLQKTGSIYRRPC